MAKSGYSEIVIGILKTHKDRIKQIELFNYQIDFLADMIRSSGRMDSMPHKTGYSNPVEEGIVRIEKLEEHRNVLQEYVDAVEFAYDSVLQNFSEEDAPIVLRCATRCLDGHKKEAYEEFETATDLPMRVLSRMQGQIIKNVLKYLRLK